MNFDFSGVGVTLQGLPGEWRSRLEREWEPFIATTQVDPLLSLDIVFEDSSESPSGEYAPKAMCSELKRESAVFRMPEGEVVVDGSGQASVRLVRGYGDRSWFTLLNFVRAGLAWRLPGRGGALLHAAGLVIDGVAYLLIGSENAGKSTWASLGRQAGAEVLSDDVVLVDRCGDRFVALGSPFRSTLKVPTRPGRHPVGALLFPRHTPAVIVGSISRLAAGARITANLPFVADAIETDRRIAEVVDALTARLPCRDFGFAPEPSFVDVLRRFSEPPDASR